MARISILGSGAVGTIVGKGFEELGNGVIFYDVDEKGFKSSAIWDSMPPLT